MAKNKAVLSTPMADHVGSRTGIKGTQGHFNSQQTHSTHPAIHRPMSANRLDEFGGIRFGEGGEGMKRFGGRSKISTPLQDLPAGVTRQKHKGKQPT